MVEIVQMELEKYRMFVAIQYLNASREIFEGMKRQCGVNNFHFLVTARSFIEYTRRGIWFLVWATDENVEAMKRLTFDRSGSPHLVQIDELINEALGKGRVSHLLDPVAAIGEPFLDCLHALTHGNPISVRILAFGTDKVFQIENMLARAEMELNLFRILVYRSALGHEMKQVWKVLEPIHNRPDDMRTNAQIAAFQLKKAGLDTALGL